MSKFKSGSALNAQLEELIKNADDFLWLISPYIKLHQRIKAQLNLKKSIPSLKVVVVFGKGEDGSNKLCYEDAAFLKEFPNIEIRYEKNLHAKYYATEDGGLITSMNLYDYSQNNNLECGVWMEAPRSIVGRVPGFSKDADVDADSYNYFFDVIQNSELLFKVDAEFDKAYMGLQMTYRKSTLKLDKLDSYVKQEDKKTDNKFIDRKEFANEQPKKSSFYSQKDKQKEYDIKGNYHFKSNWNSYGTQAHETGYCIRTGVEIPFNPNRPFCYESYSSWAHFGNPDYPEKYCHKSGKVSYGKTSYNNPIL